ncbi:hypothetical protein ACHHYP_08716 [Achlya hypogyna]|uniref:WRKY19-like zinc finger domain-containing protein n=1 Tax=Achlya hypogyna TaxID=1202772 RepID=A0A1V9ZK34_ACHHY|nr:hypothetical protein ACHHYP_08716 [Achlya hypogyna]
MTSSNLQCCFNACANAALDAVTRKCHFHRNRSKCAVTDCWNQVYARGRCVGHGGRKPCAFAGCQAKARCGLFCTRHSTKSQVKQTCEVLGCGRSAHAKGMCLRHGRTRVCRVDGCETLARKGGHCWSHGKQLQQPTVDAALSDFADDDDDADLVDALMPLWAAESAKASLDTSILDLLIQLGPVVSV